MLFGNQILSFVSHFRARPVITTSVIAMSLFAAGCSKSDSGSTSVVDNSSNAVASNDTNTSTDGSTDMMPSNDDTMMMPSDGDGGSGSGSGSGSDDTIDPSMTSFPGDDGTGSGDTTDTTDLTTFPNGDPAGDTTGTGSGFDSTNPTGDTTDPANLTGDTTFPTGDDPAGDTTTTTDPSTGFPGAGNRNPRGGANTTTTTTTDTFPGGNPNGNQPPGDTTTTTTTIPGNLNAEGLGGTTGTTGGPSTGAVPQAPPASSPLHPAFHVVMALNQGNVKGLSKYISSRARGTLGSLRSGNVSAKQIADYKAAFAKPSTPKTKAKSGETTITIPSGDYRITMRVKKERTAFVLTSLSYRKSK